MWVQFAGDGVLGSVYLLLAAALVYLWVRARSALPMPWLYTTAAIFSFMCGVSHWVSVATHWSPFSWAGATVKTVCALASLATIISFIYLLPDIVAKLIEAHRAREILLAELETRTGELDTLAINLADSRAQAESARAEAARASRMKSDFISLVSHEMRTPTTALMLSVGRLQQIDPTSPEGRELAQRVARASARLVRISQTLLDYASLRAGESAPKLAPVRIDELVDGTVAQLHARAAAKGIALRVQRQADGLTIISDKQLVELALRHLIENAVDCTRVGSVEVSVSAVGPKVAVEVRDTGPGLPERVKRTLFEPFEPGEAVAQKHAPGLGLGLALIRRVVTSLGGSIDLIDTSERGTAFAIVLPRGVQ